MKKDKDILNKYLGIAICILAGLYGLAILAVVISLIF